MPCWLRTQIGERNETKLAAHSVALEEFQDRARDGYRLPLLSATQRELKVICESYCRETKEV